ncbi:hypothetical protein [Pseudomonas coleopterorum]|nr:hypothetical protein [Pseudomonas coleopterorum]
MSVRSIRKALLGVLEVASDHEAARSRGVAECNVKALLDRRPWPSLA